MDPTSPTALPPTSRVARLQHALEVCSHPAETPLERTALFQTICERVIDPAHTELAVIAVSCRGTAGPAMIAGAAGAVDALPALNLGTNEQPLTDLMGAALLQDRPVVCRRSRSDPAHVRWAGRAWQLGFAAACAMPFAASATCTGVLGVFSADEQAFAPDVLDALVDIAAALSRP